MYLLKNSIDPDQKPADLDVHLYTDCKGKAYPGSAGPGFWWWLGGAKLSCILHHRGVQLSLAYSWAWPAILVAGKCRGEGGGGGGEMFLFLLFLHFHSFSSFSPVPLCHLLY